MFNDDVKPSYGIRYILELIKIKYTVCTFSVIYD